ncbi:MAG: hypothetical protein WC340_19655 [Kiritimatiellia bacterium]|jgi:uncharacterized Fe-S cluster-containing MiaB family protein
MDEQAKLRLHIELFDAQENYTRMEEAKKECIDHWNADLRAAKRLIERLQNKIRSGAMQPELLKALTKNDKTEQ